jgi:hypothetical protein
MLPIILAQLLIASLPVEARFTKKWTNSSDGYGPLTFRSDGTFQISIFEDLHFGESRFPPRRNTHGEVLNTKPQMPGIRGALSKISIQSKSLTNYLILSHQTWLCLTVT